MKISDINSITNTNPITQTTTSGLSTNDFYKLLAAQLQYQDPLGSGSSGSGSSNSDFMTQLAIMSATSAVQDMTKVENYSMSMIAVGNLATYKSVTTKSNGDKDTSLVTGKIEAVDYSSGTPQFLIASTKDGKTTGSWVGYTDIQRIYANDVTDDSAAAASDDSTTGA